MLQTDHINSQSLQQGGNDNAGDQVAEYGSEAKPGGNGNGDDTGDQQHEGQSQKTFHR